MLTARPHQQETKEQRRARKALQKEKRERAAEKFAGTKRSKEENPNDKNVTKKSRVDSPVKIEEVEENPFHQDETPPKMNQPPNVENKENPPKMKTPRRPSPSPRNVNVDTIPVPPRTRSQSRVETATETTTEPPKSSTKSSTKTVPKPVATKTPPLATCGTRKTTPLASIKKKQGTPVKTSSIVAPATMPVKTSVVAPTTTPVKTSFVAPKTMPVKTSIEAPKTTPVKSSIVAPKESKFRGTMKLVFWGILIILAVVMVGVTVWYAANFLSLVLQSFMTWKRSLEQQAHVDNMEIAWNLFLLVFCLASAYFWGWIMSILALVGFVQLSLQTQLQPNDSLWTTGVVLVYWMHAMVRFLYVIWVVLSPVWPWIPLIAPLVGLGWWWHRQHSTHPNTEDPPATVKLD